MQKQIEKFNEEFKVGDQVDYEDESGKIVRAFTRWPAEFLNDSGRAVLWVSGRANAVDFTKVVKTPVKML